MNLCKAFTPLRFTRGFSGTNKGDVKIKGLLHSNYKRVDSFGTNHPTNELRIGIALGSGSARGWAHIGILKALAEAGIHPHVVTGTSVGSLIAGGYCAGMIDKLEEYANSVTWKEKVNLADVSIFKGNLSSLIYGDKIAERIRQGAGKDFEIETLPTAKFGCVATKIKTGEEVWITKGSMVNAIRASIAIPGVFAPTLHDVDGKDEWLADGALVNPVPVSLCRALGANFVIAVNLNKEVFARKLTEKSSIEFDKSVESLITSRLFSPLPKKVIDTISSLSEYLSLSKIFSKTSSQTPSGMAEIHQKVEELQKAKEEMALENPSPHIIKVVTTSILVMQHVITTFRLANDPPEVELCPHLDMEAFEFERGRYAIEQGRICINEMLPSIREEIEKFKSTLK